MTDHDLEMIAKLKAQGFDVDALSASSNAAIAKPDDDICQSDLTDHEWSLLSELIPERYMSRPRASERYRKLFDALIWLKHSRAPETAMPEMYGTCAGVRKLREAMALRGDFANILTALPTLGLEPKRLALLSGICDEAHRRGQHIIAMRRRSAVASLH